MLFVFVLGSEFDLSDDTKDLVYTWKCPRDNIDCDDKSDVDWQGWVTYAILMTAHLLPDLVNGIKVVSLSGRKRYHSRSTRWRFFLGGMFLLIITTFILYVSTIYNEAIATSNTEIIINSVVILFVSDIDELFHAILMCLCKNWVADIEDETLSVGVSRTSIASRRRSSIDGHGGEEVGEVGRTTAERFSMFNGDIARLKEQNHLAQQQIRALEEAQQQIRALQDNGERLDVQGREVQEQNDELKKQNQLLSEQVKLLIEQIRVVREGEG